MRNTAPKPAKENPVGDHSQFHADAALRNAKIDTDRLRLVGQSLSALACLCDEAGYGNKSSPTTLDLNDMASLLGLLSRELFDAGEGAI